MFVYSLELATAAIQYIEVVKKDIMYTISCTNTYFILPFHYLFIGRNILINLLNLPKFSPTNILHHSNEKLKPYESIPQSLHLRACI